MLSSDRHRHISSERHRVHYAYTDDRGSQRDCGTGSPREPCAAARAIPGIREFAQLSEFQIESLTPLTVNSFSSTKVVQL